MASLLTGSPGTTTTTVSQQTPPWMQDAIYNTITWAQNLANKPYAPYEQPRIAGFTPTEQLGMKAAVQEAGAYQPYLGAATGALGRAAEASTLTAAQPYLAQAAQTFPGAVSQYMSPYNQAVTQRIADIGLRQLQEKFLPAVGEEFIKAGQFGPGPGSSRMGEFGARALRDVQESVLAEQAKALQAGYGQAADIFGKDVSRAAELAGTVGRLSAEDIANLRSAATQYGTMGEAAQALGLRGAAAVTGVGQAERDMAQRALDLAYQQYQEETKYPYEQLGYQAGIIGGFPAGATGITKTESTIEKPVEPSDLSKILGGLAGATALYKAWKGT